MIRDFPICSCAIAIAVWILAALVWALVGSAMADVVFAMDVAAFLMIF
jgi:hypothetical protein